MQFNLQRLFSLVTGLWVGGLITVGFLVTPILFSALGDRQVAGMVAGHLFKAEANLSVFLSVVLMILANLLVRQGHDQFRIARWTLLGMLACAISAAFILIPWMESVKDQALYVGMNVMESSFAELFTRLHNISSIVFGTQSLLGLFLAWHLTMK